MNAEAAIQEAGIGMPDDHAARGLLVAELVAWVEDRWRSGQDDLPGEAVGELCEPVDPTGELEGGRPVTGQLLYRRVDGKGPHGVHRDERGGGLSRTDIGGGKMPA